MDRARAHRALAALFKSASGDSSDLHQLGAEIRTEIEQAGWTPRHGVVEGVHQIGILPPEVATEAVAAEPQQPTPAPLEDPRPPVEEQAADDAADEEEDEHPHAAKKKPHHAPRHRK